MEEDDPNLPVVRKNGPIDRLKTMLAELDGPLSPSNAFVPLRAYDVGDIDGNENPRARELDYLDSTVSLRHASDRANEYVMYDEDLGATYTIHVGEDCVIDSLSKWA